MTASTIEAPPEATEESVAEARAALEAEQDHLDAEDQHPDRPEGAADDEPSLAERTAAASGLTADHAAAREEEAEVPLLGLSWADLIGGEEPTAVKIKLAGGSIEVVPPAEGLKKGSRHVLQVEVVVDKVEIADSRDKETDDVTATVDTRRLKVRSARFIDTPTA